MKKKLAALLLACSVLSAEIEQSTWFYTWPAPETGGPYHIIIRNGKVPNIGLPSITPWLEINYVLENYPPDVYYIDIYQTNQSGATLIYSNFPVRWKLPEWTDLPQAPTGVRVIP